MLPFSCQHREQHIYKRNYEITVVREIHVLRLELYNDGPLNFLFPLQTFLFGI
jgi:hypothetical protein